MEEDYIVRNQVEMPDDFVAIQKGKKLREKGYELHWHPIWGHSVKIPSGEQLCETEMKVRYGDSKDRNFKKELREALEYLVICEEVLMKTSEVSRGFKLGV